MMRSLLLGMFLLTTSVIGYAQNVIYVDQNADPTPHDGSDWARAWPTLQEALDAVGSDTIVRVADGTYFPTEQSEPGVARTETFQLVDGVTLEGGYAGFGAPDPDARDVALYATILSGDIGVPGDAADNCYHVVSADGVSFTLDGLTITAGNADDDVYGPKSFGGGLYNTDGDPTLRYCTFRENSARCYGGGMYSARETYSANISPVLIHCAFERNSADVHGGGGLFFYRGGATLTDCTFVENLAHGGDGGSGGGGMFVSGARLSLSRCMFRENMTVIGSGGGLFCMSDSLLTFSDCTFEGNSAGYAGGGVYYSGHPMLTNCAFEGNSAGYVGGGVYYSGHPMLTDCTFKGNSAEFAGGGCGGGASGGGAATLVRCSFSRNSATGSETSYGGGFDNMYGEATLIDCDFHANTADKGGGVSSDVHPYYLDPVIALTGCTFVANAAEYGGGMHVSGISSIGGSTFYGNSSNEGGGVYSVGATTLSNCLFSGNSSDKGGGIYNVRRLNASNCTFSENSASTIGGAVSCYVRTRSTDLTNCILWGDTAPVGAEIGSEEPDAFSLVYCCIQGGWPGEGNIDANPLSVDADGPDDVAGTADDDLRLQAGSPCVDAGDNSDVGLQHIRSLSGEDITLLVDPIDLDGHYRRFDDPATIDTGLGVAPVVDMGAYEFGSTSPPLWGDLNCDGAVNAFDIDPFVLALTDPEAYAAMYPQCQYGLANCNADGAVNAFDIDPFIVILVGG